MATNLNQFIAMRPLYAGRKLFKISAISNAIRTLSQNSRGPEPLKPDRPFKSGDPNIRDPNSPETSSNSRGLNKPPSFTSKLNYKVVLGTLGVLTAMAALIKAFISDRSPKENVEIGPFER